MKRTFRSLEHTIKDVWIKENSQFEWGGFKIGRIKPDIVNSVLDPAEIQELDGQRQDHINLSFAHKQQAERLKKQIPFVSEEQVANYTNMMVHHTTSEKLHDGVVTALEALIKHKKTLPNAR